MPSGPAVIPWGLLLTVGIGNSATSPAGVIRPILHADGAVGHLQLAQHIGLAVAEGQGLEGGVVRLALSPGPLALPPGSEVVGELGDRENALANWRSGCIAS